MDLMFKDLDVYINKKQILKKVCGMAKQGEMLAIMGTSGSGKSTLLNALAGRYPLHDGQITLNNEPINKQLKRKINYVLQQDVFFSNLTLKETMTFNALLCLPEKMPYDLKIKRIDEILTILELNNCSSTIMGSTTIQGLSGGERKRASIAMQLLTNPLVLLIDEPISGLDYAIAYNLMKLMKDYTERTNKTLMITIHQPSSQMFHMFNNLLLLVDGQVGYFGEAANVLNFFSSVGLHCKPNYNPADFIVEKARQGSETTNAIIAKSREVRFSEWPNELRSVYSKANEETYIKHGLNELNDVPEEVIIQRDINVKPSDLLDIKTFKSSTDSGFYSTTEDTTGLHRHNIVKTDMDMDIYLDRDCKWPTGFWTQYKVLKRRTLKQARHGILSPVNVGQIVVITLFACMLWFQVDRSEESLRDRMGVIFYSSVGLSFYACFWTLNTFPEERPVILRERSAGIYRLSAYYMSKMTSELPVVCLLPLLYFCVAYWTTGLASNVGCFLAALGTFLLFILTMQGFALFLGCAITDMTKAHALCTVFLLTTMLAGGYYRSVFPGWSVWLNYISIYKYQFECMLTIEFKYGEPLKCLPANQTFFASCLDSNTTMVTGTEVLKRLNITLPLWVYYIVIIGFMFCMRILGYLMLRFINRPQGIK